MRKRSSSFVALDDAPMIAGGITTGGFFVAENFEFIPGETLEFLTTVSGVTEPKFRLSNQDQVDVHIAGGHDEHAESATSDGERAVLGGENAEAADAADVLLVLAVGENGTLVFTVPRQRLRLHRSGMPHS
jgi:hypothetical protein